MGQSLASSILRFDPNNPEAFIMITGVGDSSTFTTVPSWLQPPDTDDLCYIGASCLMMLRLVIHPYSRQIVGYIPLDFFLGLSPNKQDH
jgi:hypothetical protein